MDIEFTEEELAYQTITVFITNIFDNEVNVDELVEKYGKGLKLTKYTDWTDYDSCDVYLELRQDRLETEEERSNRLEKLKITKLKNASAAIKRKITLEKKKAEKEAEERALYETLRKKFEKND